MSARAPIAFLAVALLAGCGGRERELPRGGEMVIQNGPGGTRVVRPGRDPNAGYIRAMEFKNNGDCANAIMLLRPIARIGPGYENAQTALGECLLTGEAEVADGLTWLTRAADAGWPEAQAALAVYRSAPGPSRDGSESAYWLALYELNPNKARVGFRPPDSAGLARARLSLTDSELTDGRKRAAAWQRKLWIPPPEPDAAGNAEETRAGRRPRG